MDSINLINFNEDKMVINNEALQLIALSDQFISAVSVCGEYRTGKSFLLNSLFSKDCFKVSPTTQACTKGINMMRKPVKMNNKNIWIFDTEGFGSLQQDGKHDAKIFLISILLSQVLIYNSSGAIDQTSISKIGMMCKQAEILAKKTYSSQKAQIQQDYLNGNVKFYWILRDFALSLINKQGKSIDPDEYLQQAIQTSSSNNQTDRKLIKKMFGQRHCFPLIRPCFNEQSIHTLRQIGDKSIRPEFIQQIKKLKRSILQSAKPKKILNKKIKGKQFAQLIRCYVEKINQENFQTNLCVTWQHIESSQRQKILQKLEDQLRKKYQQYEKILPLGQDDIQRLQKQIKLTLKQHTYCISHNENSLRIIQEEIQKIKNQLTLRILQDNNNKINQKCNEYLNQCYQQIANKLTNLASLSNFNEKFEGQVTKLRKNYFLRFNNFSSLIVHQQYCIILQKILNNLFRGLVMKWCEDQSSKMKKIQQLKKQKRIIQLQIEQRIIKQETLARELAITKGLYQQSTKNTHNYIQIIDRMQRVSQNLRKQFQIIKESQLSLKHTLQLKIIQHQQQNRKYQLNQQTLLHQLQSALELNKQKEKYIDQLKKQIVNVNQANQREMKDKIENILTVLNNQRQHFQNLIVQRNSQQHSLRSQIQQKQHLIFKIRQQFAESTNFLKAQFQQTIIQLEIEHDNKMKQRQNRIIQFNKINQELHEQIDKLSKQIQKITSQNQIKTSKVLEQRTKHRELQKKLLDKQKEYEQKRSKLQKQNTQFRESTKQLQQKIRVIQKRNKQQLQQMSRKLFDSLENCQSNSKQKQQYMKKQYQIQRQDIANKLTQAADRIQKMNIKQNKLTNKIHQYEQQTRKLKEQLKKYQTQTGECKMCIQMQIRLRDIQQNYNNIVQGSAQLQEIIKIQQNDVNRLKDKNKNLIERFTNNGTFDQNPDRKNLQMCKNILKNQELQQLRLQVKKQQDQKQKQRILWNKKQQAYIQIIENIKKQKQTIKNLNNKQKQNSPKIKNNKQNPQNIMQIEKWQVNSFLKEDLQMKIQQLSLQNRKIKNQLQIQREKVDKLRNQSIKSINFHAYMKRNKIAQQEQQQNLDSIKQNSLQFHQKLITKQKIIDQLLKKIEQLINNQLQLNNKIDEQKTLLVAQAQQIEHLRDQFLRQREMLCDLRKNRQKLRNQLQSNKAQYHLTIQKLQKQIHTLSKKHSNLWKQTQLWKMKALQVEQKSLVHNSQHNALYKQKIDSLFKKH